MDVKELLRGEGGSRHVWEKARFDVVRDLLRFHLPDFGKKGDALLDFGCGDGYILGELARLYGGADFTGIDNALSPALLETLNRRHPSVKVMGNLEQVSGTFKAVLLLDVLEHIRNDRGFLSELGLRREASNAVFFITAPAFNRLFSSHDRFLGHHRRYTLSQLTETATQAGFKVQQGGYFFCTLLLVRIAEVFFESLFPSRERKNYGLSGWKGHGLLDAALTRILYADYKILQFLKRMGMVIPGLSCFVVCRKQR